MSALRRLQRGIVVHAANSAATLRVPASHFDMVRCGIAIYGCDPMNEDPDRFGLEPALELTRTSRRSSWRGRGRAPATGGGSSPSTRRGSRRSRSATATGSVVRFTNNCDVLVGGRRYPLVGTVSMDNITVDLGPEPAVRVGDPATIIGRDGSERQTAEDLALRIGTINYEIVCGISPRVPRAYHRDGEPCER